MARCNPRSSNGTTDWTAPLKQQVVVAGKQQHWMHSLMLLSRYTHYMLTIAKSPRQVLRPRLASAMRVLNLAHQNRTIAIASDFRLNGAKSPEIPQKEGVLDPEIAARNRKSLATCHRTLKSQCSIACSCLGNRCDFWGPR